MHYAYWTEKYGVFNGEPNVGRINFIRLLEGNGLPPFPTPQNKGRMLVQ